MTITIRPMRIGEEGLVAAMIAALTAEVEPDFKPRISAANLAADSDIAKVMIAELDGHLVGTCIYVLTYSSWRGGRGVYICDLYIAPEARDKKLGVKLLHATIADAARLGAIFVKLEVQEENRGAARFYQRLGFTLKSNDGLYVLEPEVFSHFLKEDKS
jgi:ribosomal protein S18 acetylase RimI-like enzyme